MKQRLFILFISFQFLLGYKATGAHILGGHMSYETISRDAEFTEIEITLTLYRDALSSGANFDQEIAIGIYNSVGSDWENYNALHGIDDQEVFMHQIGSLPYVVSEFNVVFESAIYKARISLPHTDNQDFIISYQRCCRVGTINNIRDPNETGFAMELMITNAGLLADNASPKMYDLPPTLGVLNVENVLQFPTEEMDGDDLNFKFCAPLESGGIEGANGTGPPLYFGGCGSVGPDPRDCPPPYDAVEFLGGFNSANPFGIQQSSQIDNSTGDITVELINPGLYSYGVCIDESRDGTLLSKTYIDHVLAVDVFELVSLIRGKPYHDLNENGIKEAGENYLNFIEIDLERDYNRKVVERGSNDLEYSFYVDNGMYNYVLEDFSPWQITNDTSIIVDELGVLYNADIGLSPRQSVQKVKARLYHEVPLCGEEIFVGVNFRNLGTQIFEGKVELNFHPNLTFVKLDAVEYEEDNSQISWNVEEIDPGDYEQYWPRFFVQGSGFEGQEIFFEVVAYNLAGQEVYREILRDEVTCEVLDNSKAIINRGDVNQITTLENHEIEYLIRFRLTDFNSFNRVVVKDTLDDNLDPKTLKLIGAGPAFGKAYSIVGQVVTFEMTGFSTVPEGYVRYSVKVRPGTPIGTEITNSAEIVVDSNNPSSTNSTLVTVIENVVSTSEISEAPLFKVYPNPAKSQIWIQLNEKNFMQANGNMNFVLQDIAGQVLTQGIIDTPLKLIKPNLPEGIYLLTIKNSNSQVLQTERIVVVDK